MGCDIHGYIECRVWWRQNTWRAAMDFDLIEGGRHYDAFGLLFGVRNYAGFRPVAANRGMPEDASEPARAEFEGWGVDAHSATWIGWDEIAQLDWSEPADEPDSRIHEFKRGPGGEWEPVGKAAWSARFAEVLGKSDRPALDYGESWPEGTEWIDGDTMFRVVRLTRREVIPEGGSWQPTWDVMAALAAVHGAANVRLVVWFDN
ncbi:hypothetical protein [Nocardia sp. NPDC051832]|uniref:hypothetical protein n=1 Tax=Nocardia sp. NPDC051832 TaxID=3155673 RepID=UPI00341468D0